MEQQDVLAPMRPGIEVVTSDGIVLGTVGRVADRLLRVDPGNGAPYWLAREDLRISPEGRVVAAFARPELGGRTRAAPDADRELSSKHGIDARLEVKPDDGTPAYLQPGTGGSGAPD